MIEVLYAFLATVFDFKFYKIPNVLCLMIALTGVFFSYLNFGLLGIGNSLWGMCIPFLSLYPLFYIGVLGAGDIKELSAFGAFFGKGIWKVLFLSFAFNGAIACLKMIKGHRFHSRLLYLKGYLRDCRLSGRWLRDYETDEKDRIHFSTGIFMVMIYMVITRG